MQYEGVIFKASAPNISEKKTAPPSLSTWHRARRRFLNPPVFMLMLFMYNISLLPSFAVNSETVEYQAPAAQNTAYAANEESVVTPESLWASTSALLATEEQTESEQQETNDGQKSTDEEATAVTTEVAADQEQIVQEEAAAVEGEPDTQYIQPTPMVQEPTSFQFPLPSYKAITTYYSAWHRGVDYATPYGTPIYAIADGAVSFAGWSRIGYGNTVTLSHGGDYTSLYAHLSKIYVTTGQYVTKGTVIGTVGCTGNCTGNHLHLEITKSGYGVNPLTVF